MTARSMKDNCQGKRMNLRTVRELESDRATLVRICYGAPCRLVIFLAVWIAGWSLSVTHADHLKSSAGDATVHLPNRGLALRPEGIKLGPVNLQPRLIVAETYDDNIFLADTDEEDDFITTIRPAINVALPWLTHLLRVGYEAEFLSFADHDDENVLNQALYADLGLDFPAGLRIRIRDRYLDTHDPASSEAETRTDDPRTSRTQNDFEVRIAYALSRKTTFEMIFLRTDHDYSKRRFDALDRNENTVSLTLFKRIWPKTSVLAGYDFQRTDFVDLPPADPDKDSQTHTGNIGVRFDPTAKVAGTLRLGYRAKRFDERSLDDTRALTADAALVWAARPKTQFYLKFLRDIEESSTTGANAIISTRAAFAMRQRFIDRFSAEVLAWYQRDDFDNLDRTDDIWQGFVVARYTVLPGLHVAAGYEYGIRDSSEDTFDYTVNRVWIFASWPTAFSFRDTGALFARFFGTFQEFERFEKPSPIRNRN